MYIFIGTEVVVLFFFSSNSLQISWAYLRGVFMYFCDLENGGRNRGQKFYEKLKKFEHSLDTPLWSKKRHYL